MTNQENNEEIKKLIIEALDNYYETIFKKNYDMNPEFVEIVTKTAEEWAKECRQ